VLGEAYIAHLQGRLRRGPWLRLFRSLLSMLGTSTHALTKNADRLALWVLRAFVVIAAPAAVCNAVDLGHHPLPFCHCVQTRMCARACVRACVRAEQPHACESRTSKQWLMSAAVVLRCMCMCARTVTRLLGCGIDVELVDSRHKLMSQRMAQRAALVPATAHR
jgi:hypothetical protein